ncbi:MAG: hypothetical protein GKC04_04835 [Methanomicrobiales archaeon]|nr:hypothetical protein [Methanomicrobiales archaeon]
MLIGEDGNCEMCRRAEQRGDRCYCIKYHDWCDHVRFVCEDDAALNSEPVSGIDDDEEPEDW